MFVESRSADHGDRSTPARHHGAEAVPLDLPPRIPTDYSGSQSPVFSPATD